MPHVTIPPVACGVGSKLRPGSRYFPYYTRPWIDDAHFDANRDEHLTGAEARAIDAAIDLYNDALQNVVAQARSGADGTARNWYLLDLAGILDRLAALHQRPQRSAALVDALPVAAFVGRDATRPRLPILDQ